MKKTNKLRKIFSSRKSLTQQCHWPFVLALVLLSLLVINHWSLTAHAAVCTWTGPDWGDWANSNNWQNKSVPGFYDTAEFKSNARVKLTKDITVTALSIANDATVELMGAFDFSLKIRNYALKLTPGVRHPKFTRTTLDASRAKALTLTGRITVKEDGKFMPYRSGLSVTAPTGRTTIGENAVLIAGESKLSTGPNSWLKLEGDVLAGNFDLNESGIHKGHAGHDYRKGALVFTNDLAAQGVITLDGTMAFNGEEGGFLAYPNTNFTFYAGGAVIEIFGGDRETPTGLLGRIDSIEDPLNGIELTNSSLTSGRSGLLLTGQARAYGKIKMRGNLILALASSLTNYDSDGFTIFADGRPVMFCVDGAEIGTGLHESFLIMRGGSQLDVNDTLPRSSGIKNWQGRLTLTGTNFTLVGDMPASGVATFEGSLKFKEGRLIVYPRMAFMMHSIDGTNLSLVGGNDSNNYDNPPNGIKLDNCKLLANGDGMTIDGSAQAFGLFNMCGTLRLTPGARLGNYDQDKATLIADGGDLMVKPAIEGLVGEKDPWADLLGENNRNGLLLRTGKTVSFNGAPKPNANSIENWSGNIVTVGSVRGLISVPLD